MIGISLPKAVFFPLLTGISLILFVVLGNALYEERRENQALQKSLEFIAHTFAEEREANQLMVDSLQGQLEEQNKVNGSLKELIQELEDFRERINTEADEKADDIRRIDDVDSLRDEIARHYGH